MQEQDDLTLDKLSKLAAIPPDADGYAKAAERVKQELLGQSEPARTRRHHRAIRLLKWALPLATAAAVVLAVGLWSDGRPGKGGRGPDRVYALADIPALLNSANVLHLHEYYFIPHADGHDAPVGTARRQIAADNWVDMTNGRWHIEQTDAGLTEGLPPSEQLIRDSGNRFFTWISDGEYVMELFYERDTFRDDPNLRKEVEFRRLSPLHRELDLRQFHRWTTQSVQELADAKAVGKYAEVGREKIDGVVFTIWEGVTDMPRYDEATKGFVYDGTRKVKTRIWLSPALGIIHHIEHWSQYRGGPWVLTGVIDKIERDVVPPPGLFETVPPPDYVLTNTKDNARFESLTEDCNNDRIGDLMVYYHIGLNLPDGTILMGWSSTDPKDPASQAPLFEGLVPGGELPKLPIQLLRLESGDPSCGLVYEGRHLVWTQKAGRFFEWSLFVPNRDLTGTTTCFSSADVVHQINSANAAAADDKHLDIAGDYFHSHRAIRSEEDFNSLVLAAMAELSDGGTAPQSVSYESVMQLAAQIRLSTTTPR